MFIPVLAAMAAVNPAEPVVPNIISASLFKNGYAMVIREVKLTGETTVITDLPNPALGTFWVTTDGAKIKEFVVTQEEINGKRPVGNFAEYLSQNVSKTVEITTINLGKLTGTIKSVNDGVLLLQDSEGVVSMIQLSEIRQVKVKDGVTDLPTKTMQRVLRIRTDKGGTLRLMGLERGMSWVPGYTVVMDGNNVRVTGKATILNDLAAFNNASLQFVTGFPNVPYASQQEPLLSGQSLDQFLGFLNSVGGQGFSGRKETMQMAMDNMPGAPSPTPEWGPVTGEQIDDLFFYKVEGVSLKKGDRAMMPFIEYTAAVKHQYDAVLPYGDVSTTAAALVDVWHSIVFMNTSKQPLTTGVATVYQSNRLMGQDMLPYTSAGIETTLRLNKALDIRVSSESKELSRTEPKLIDNVDKRYYQEITLECTAEIQNLKKEALVVNLKKTVTGTVTENPDNAKVIKNTFGFRELNPISNIEWNLNLKAGETRTVKIRYTTRVQV